MNQKVETGMHMVLKFYKHTELNAPKHRSSPITQTITQWISSDLGAAIAQFFIKEISGAIVTKGMLTACCLFVYVQQLFLNG